MKVTSSAILKVVKKLNKEMEDQQYETGEAFILLYTSDGSDNIMIKFMGNAICNLSEEEFSSMVEFESDLRNNINSMVETIMKISV